MAKLVPIESIISKIVFLRNEKVILDRDLAELYGVETKQLKRAVRRNINRFPKDFMFELTKKEFDILRYHFGTSSWGGTRYTPMAFTEQGVAMLSSVLNSEPAIEVNVAIIRAFVHLRKMVSSHKELARKLKELEQHLQDHDEEIQAIFEAIQQLISLPENSQKKIGFTVKERTQSLLRKKDGKKAGNQKDTPKILNFISKEKHRSYQLLFPFSFELSAISFQLAQRAFVPCALFLSMSHELSAFSWPFRAIASSTLHLLSAISFELEQRALAFSRHLRCLASHLFLASYNLSNYINGNHLMILRIQVNLWKQSQSTCRINSPAS